jgi:hypothetical protein
MRAAAAAEHISQYERHKTSRERDGQWLVQPERFPGHAAEEDDCQSGEHACKRGEIAAIPAALGEPAGRKCGDRIRHQVSPRGTDQTQRARRQRHGGREDGSARGAGGEVQRLRGEAQTRAQSGACQHNDERREHEGARLVNGSGSVNWAAAAVSTAAIMTATARAGVRSSSPASDRSSSVSADAWAFIGENSN